jgi:hypothetical protein
MPAPGRRAQSARDALLTDARYSELVRMTERLGFFSGIAAGRENCPPEWQCEGSERVGPNRCGEAGHYPANGDRGGGKEGPDLIPHRA